MEANAAMKTNSSPARQTVLGGVKESREGGMTNSARLIELANHEEKLLERIQELNCQGVLRLQNGNHEQALQFFQQCEATLEYAASCGKTLDRSLILTVLNNSAAAYQRSQDQEKAASYVEAIIYNLNLFLDGQQNRLLLSQLNQITSRTEDARLGKMETDAIKVYAMRKYDLAVNLLQFAGLQSQYMAHQESLGNARKAVKVIKELSIIQMNIEKMMKQIKNLAILEDLCELPLTIDHKDYEGLRMQFERLSMQQQETPLTTTSELSPEASLMLERTNFLEIFSLKTKQVHSNIIQQRTPPFTYHHYLQQVLLIVCAYFTMGAELEELDEEQHCSSIYLEGTQKEKNRQGECYHLMALIIGLKHIPQNNKFIKELLEIYQQTYKNILPQQSMNQNLNHLTQKYKNYLIQKDISISLQESDQLMKGLQGQNEVNEQKKESKRLNELLKQEPISTHGKQENYFAQLPSIDSIQITNSLSGHNKTNNSNKEPPINQHPITIHTKMKSHTSINYNQESRVSQASNHQNTRENDNNQSNNLKLKVIRNKKTTSKSKSIKSKSKGKLLSTKKMEKRPLIIPTIGLTSTTKRSSSKNIKSKRSSEKDLHKMIRSAGVDHNRLTGSDTRKIGNSEQFKSAKMGSVKNIEPIRMNKVKGVVKKETSASNLHEMRSLQAFPKDFRSNQRDERQKSKSKNSVSLKSNQSNNNSSKNLLKKTLTKDPSSSKDKVYTSIKHTVRK